jgi:hypothetical protein
MNIKRALATGLFGITLLCSSTCSSLAAFTGPYMPGNWSLVNSNADGTLDLTGSPETVRLIGGNNYSFDPGMTEWTILAVTAATIQFDWSYTTSDDSSGPWDRAGWRKNGTYVELARNDSAVRNGHGSFEVNPGDTFGFWVRTADNLVAPGELTISSFESNSGATAPAPRFVSASLSEETVSVQFETIPGRTYCVMASGEVTGTNWTQIGSNVTASGALTSFPAGPNHGERRFFRAVLLP